jgi:hypothetical protein
VEFLQVSVNNTGFASGNEGIKSQKCLDNMALIFYASFAISYASITAGGRKTPRSLNLFGGTEP